MLANTSCRKRLAKISPRATWETAHEGLKEAFRTTFKDVVRLQQLMQSTDAVAFGTPIGYVVQGDRDEIRSENVQFFAKATPFAKSKWNEYMITEGYQRRRATSKMENTYTHKERATASVVYTDDPINTVVGKWQHHAIMFTTGYGRHVLFPFLNAPEVYLSKEGTMFIARSSSSAFAEHEQGVQRLISSRVEDQSLRSAYFETDYDPIISEWMGRPVMTEGQCIGIDLKGQRMQRERSKFKQET